MIEACVQGVRARAARGGRASTRRRPACRRTKGTLTERERVRAHRHRRLRHGQPPLGREGARARRRASRRSPPTRRARARPTASCVPGVGAFPRAMRRLRASRPRRAAARARGRGRAGARASASGMQLLFERSVRAGRRRGPGAAARRGRARSTRRRLKLPHIGWNDVRWRAPVAAHRRAAATRAPSTTCTPSRRVPADDDDRARHRRVRRAVRRPSSAATASSASSSTPRSPRAHGLRAAAQLRRACATRSRGA